MSKYKTTKDGLVKDTETGATGIFRTVGGRRIFIKDGQDLASAMKESGKFSKKEKNDKELKREKLRNLDEYSRGKLIEKLTKEEEEEYWHLNDERKKASKHGNKEKAEELKRKREDMLIKKMDEKENQQKTKVIKNISDKKDEISNNINEAIDDFGENGRFDTGRNTEELMDRIYEDTEKILGRELKEEDFDYIDNQLSAYYKDGFYVSKGSFSLKEYENKVNPILDKVEYELSSRGWETQESHSQYPGLATSRYFTKDGITIRIGDHTNSNGSMPSHTREQLFNSNVNDLVKYVEDNYENRKKTKN